MRPPNKGNGGGDSSANLLRLARLITFLAAIGLGAALGWRLFLAPASALPPAAEATAPRAQADAAQTREALVLPTGSPATGLGHTVQVGSPAPDFTLPNLTGEAMTLSDFRGQVVLVNFWATWCSPCREEMPALQRAHERLADQGLVILGVNWTQVDEAEAAATFARELGLTFPILLDHSGEVTQDLYQVLGLPTSVVIGRDGIVRALRIGALDIRELEDSLQSLLAEGT